METIPYHIQPAVIPTLTALQCCRVIEAHRDVENKCRQIILQTMVTFSLMSLLYASFSEHAQVGSSHPPLDHHVEGKGCILPGALLYLAVFHDIPRELR